MRRREAVHERQRRRHPPRERLVGRVAEQRVEPDHAARAALDAQQLRGEDVRVPGVPAVGEDDHDRAAVDQRRPAAIELRERLADPGAPRPVPHRGEPAQHLAIGARPQIVRDPRQPHRERERLHARERGLQREEELQEKPAVEVHRARDVAQEHQADLLALASPEAQVDELSAREIGAQRAAQVDPPAARGRPAAPADAPCQSARDAQREAIDLVELVRRERGEVARGHRLELGSGGHADRLLAALPVSRFLPRVERQRLAPGPLEPGRVLGQPGGRERFGHAVGLGAGPPEGVEGAVEGGKILGTAREHGPQPGANFRAIGEVELLERAHAVRDVLRRDGQSVTPQQRRETHHRGVEAAAHLREWPAAARARTWRPPRGIA